MQFSAGDHLTVPLQFGVGEHHGIYVGKGEVIHYTGSTKASGADATIRKDTVEKFADGRPIEVVPDDESCWSPEKAVAYAFVCWKNWESWPAYNLMKNNCEHFVNFCKSGKAFSRQIEKLKDLLGLDELKQLGEEVADVVKGAKYASF